MNNYEEIKHEKKLLAIILRGDFKAEKITFFSPPEFSQQLGFLPHRKGNIISAHFHHNVKRKITKTQEVLFIRKGTIQVFFYTKQKKYLTSRTLGSGDVIFLCSGGHGIKVLEDSEIIEVKEDKIKIVHKPQNITVIPKFVSGKVFDLLSKNDVGEQMDQISEILNLTEILDREISVLSGGELQRVAIAAAYLKDGDVYLIDEPSSYLDVSERINMAKLIRSLTENDKTVVVVEHDLAILDYLSDYISLFYGAPSVYGIISHPQGVRVGINMYLNGYIKDENIRIREAPIQFHERPPIDSMFDIGDIILSVFCQPASYR